ncbi:MAG: hypothetical protein U0703_19150 [Anaerolineae bacterium]
MQAPPNVLIVAQADVFADDPNAAEWLDKVDTVIALSLFPDELTAKAKSPCRSRASPSVTARSPTASGACSASTPLRVDGFGTPGVADSQPRR